MATGGKTGKGMDVGNGADQGKGTGQDAGKGLSPGPQHLGADSKGGKVAGKYAGKGLSPGPEDGKGKDKGGGGKGDKSRRWRAARTPEEMTKYNSEERQAKARRQRVAERVNTLTKGKYRVPWLHRRNRMPYSKVQKIAAQMIPKGEGTEEEGRHQVGRSENEI